MHDELEAEQIAVERDRRIHILNNVTNVSQGTTSSCSSRVHQGRLVYLTHGAERQDARESSRASNSGGCRPSSSGRRPPPASLADRRVGGPSCWVRGATAPPRRRR